MCSRWVPELLLALLAVAGCEREAREFRPAPLPQQEAPAVLLGMPLAAEALPPQHTRAAQFAGNAYHIGEGQRLFTWMNCSGCHAHGGGDIGPPLMDAAWRYGSSMAAIVASIDQGRPNGMPAFRGKLTVQQMWQLAAYVRSLSGQTRKDAVAARADEMSSTRPLTRMPEQPEKAHDDAGVRVPPP